MHDPAKGLPIFHLHQSPSDDKGPPRRIVFDFELGCVIHDGPAPGRSVVHFGGNSYDIEAPLEEAVDELLAVTVSVELKPGTGAAAVDVHAGEQPASADPVAAAPVDVHAGEQPASADPVAADPAATANLESQQEGTAEEQPQS